MTNRLSAQLEFIVELDHLKNIYRQTYVLHEDRREDDAEHSWHAALMVPLLAEYSNEPIDILKTMKMLLVHDVVEIDAGDTYCYDAKAGIDKREREEKAASRIFGMLPDDMTDEYYELWHEFEYGISPESKFAAAMDRVQPLLLNIGKNGLSWKEHGIHLSQVLKRASRIGESSDVLYEYIMSILEKAADDGLLIRD